MANLNPNDQHACHCALKRRFLGALSPLAAVLLLTHASQAAPAGSGPDLVVFPTGEWPADVEHVQAALDQGGTVLLKATDVAGHRSAFDFGPSDSRGGFVSVTTDVTILGEVAGRYMTTIRGGFLAFRSLAPVAIAIRGIHFDRSGFVAIEAGVTSGIEITGNVITHVVAGGGANEAIAIFISNQAHPDQIGGTVTIADNIIAVDEGGDAAHADGIVILGASADLAITGNSVTDAHTVGISAARARRVSILNNVVVPGAADPPIDFGNGISVTSPLDGGEDIVIRGNTVVCENPRADGITLAGLSASTSGSTIEGNAVTMHGSDFGGISLYGSVSHTYVGANLVTGDGAFALQVAQGNDPADTASSNRLQGNNLSGFTSSTADAFFDINARYNVLIGDCDSVLDLGTGNRHTCGAGAATNPADATMRSAEPTDAR